MSEYDPVVIRLVEEKLETPVEKEKKFRDDLTQRVKKQAILSHIQMTHPQTRGGHSEISSIQEHPDGAVTVSGVHVRPPLREGMGEHRHGFTTSISKFTLDR